MTSGAVRGRDLALDVIRGGCVLMMTFGHLAPETWVNRVLHLPLWIDGASGFVLLSGLVLGLVQEGRLHRGGVAGAQRALARRAGLVYAWHVAVVLLALLVGSAVGVRAGWLPHADDHGAPAGALVRTVLLQINPPYLDILSLYVVLFGLAMAALALLHRGRLGVLCALSAVVYVLGQVAPELTTLPSGEGSPSEFDWAAWQLLFLSGFVAGWYWRRRGLAAVLTSRRAVLTALGVAAAIYLTCLPPIYLGVAPALHDAAAAFVEKSTAGPGWIALAWAAFVVAYATLTRLLRGMPAAAFGVLSTIGRRSLDCYVLLTLVVVLAPVAAGRVVGGAASIGLAVAAVAAMCGWVWLRDRVTDLRRGRTFPADPPELHGLRRTDVRPVAAEPHR